MGFCAPVAADEKARLSAAEQLVVVQSADWDAAQGLLRRFERPRPHAPFVSVAHDHEQPMLVWLGRAGLAWRSDGADDSANLLLSGPRKREGDGRAPAGLFALRELWGYAATRPTGVRLAYHQADAKTRCVDDADSPLYNQIVAADKGLAPFRSAENLLLSSDHYKYLVVIDYNIQTPRPSAGSCIFLHVAPPPGEPTAGCTAAAEKDLLTLLRWLDERKHPLLLQLPRAALAAAQIVWKLPAEVAK